MSDTSLKRQLKLLTIPVFIEMALVMMLGAVDTVMLSRYSDNSVAAVGLDNQLISLVFLVYQFFSMGAAILVGHLVGVSYVIGIPLGYGLVGMWVGFALDENIRGVILMRRWRSNKWRTKGFVK